MEKLILDFFENLHFVFIVVAIICFVIPIICILVRRKVREKKRSILDKYTIMIDAGIYDRLLLIIFLSIFFITGLILIYLAITKSENTTILIFGIISGIITCVIPIVISFNTIKMAKNILNGNYIIIEDELKDKYYYNDSSSDNVDHSCWRLYFKDYFKLYDSSVRCKNIKEGNKYKIGDKFYLVFINGDSYPYIFAKKEYNLTSDESKKLKTFDEVTSYIKLKKFILENEKFNEKIVINKKRIIDDFYDKKQKQTVFFDVFAVLFILLGGILIAKFYFYLIAIIIISLMFIFFLVICITKIKYLLTIINNIKRDNYKIKEDEVISLNNNIQYSDSNKVISFKFKNYKNIVYSDKKNYLDTKVGDKFYLIFVKGEKAPIKVYAINNSILDKELNVEYN